ncbi:MAG: UDP-4-amino-4,6-dideoxy-N-acetyl-beta-L-altrosamine transaminase [Nitrospirae bacterium]|nr:MAG: UDP-4-amino-4,6-dideoxy-N-acetyl-beta-L-altrosamine transaminase [Nitrospirota bacterium]
MSQDQVEQPTIPYGMHSIDESDIRAVVGVLRSDWLTTGPRVEEFERVFARTVGATEAVALANGTAALHAAMYAIGLGPGDEVILPPLTFVASANAVVMQGGVPVFADVDAATLLLDPDAVEAAITPRTKAILAVDYAGQPCDYETLRQIADRHGLVLVADACHALGASLKGSPVGSLADLTVFGFHPVKAITTGEGGMVATLSPDFARRIRLFRNHGITTDHHARARRHTWEYDMVDLGMNYRITDFQCALGLSQLGKLPQWIRRRQALAQRYTVAWNTLPGIVPLAVREGVEHAYHLYVVRLRANVLGVDRAHLFSHLRHAGIGVNVHYRPVHLQPYYRKTFGTGPGLCPVAEAAYEEILSLPLYPSLEEETVDWIIATLQAIVKAPTSLSVVGCS